MKAIKKYAYFGFLAVIYVSICSKSSPLYVINNWGDANVFLTIGRGMLEGKIPYRDLFDHKGPVLYFIHALAAIISQNSFLGVYVIEIINCILFLFIGSKMIELFIGKQGITPWAIMLTLIYAANAFSYGDSAEELCLPFLLYALYIEVKFILEDRLPSLKESFYIGITSGIVFWIKYTMVGLYVGWIIMPFMLAIQKKQLADFMQRVGTIVIGVVATSVPIISYFGANLALGDMLEVYFGANLSLYSNNNPADNGNLGIALKNGINNMYLYNRPILFVCIIVVAFFALRKQWMLMLSIFFMEISLFVSTFGGGRAGHYYSFSFAVFAPLIMIMCNALVKRLKNIRIIYYILDIVGVIMVILFSPNVKDIKQTKNCVQYQVKEWIDSEMIENPSLLNYGFLDEGFYMVCGITPTSRYFFMPNIMRDEIVKCQNKEIENGKFDIIIAKEPWDFDQYQVVASFDGENMDGYSKYYLLERKGLN